jgi:hypothetical protein
LAGGLDSLRRSRRAESDASQPRHIIGQPHTPQIWASFGPIITVRLRVVDFDQLRRELEAAGETAVTQKLAQGVIGREKRAFVKNWLREKEAVREQAEAAKRDVREDEALRLSREANEHAAQANKRSAQSNWIAGLALNPRVSGVGRSDPGQVGPT